MTLQFQGIGLLQDHFILHIRLLQDHFILHIRLLQGHFILHIRLLQDHFILHISLLQDHFILHIRLLQGHFILHIRLLQDHFILHISWLLHWHLGNNTTHDDVIKWKHFPRYWSLVRGIHRSPMNSPHRGRWRGALMFSLICAWTNGWVNNREAGDLRRYRAHYDVTVMGPSVGETSQRNTGKWITSETQQRHNVINT